MRLLVVTQAVDRDNQALGFFVEWLREFSHQCERIDVIAFRVGQHDLPANVRVHDARAGGHGSLARFWRYQKLLAGLLPQVDAIFVHMSPEYVIAAWPALLWRRRPTILWYAHRSLTLRLRVAAAIVDRIVTSVPGAITMKSPKIVPVGQGIPTDVFRPMPDGPRGYRMVTVGRLTQIKRLELMIEALAIVRAAGVPATLDLFGEPVLAADTAYVGRMRALASARGVADAVGWNGALPFMEFPARYASYALALNMAPTGAPDKAVLEAMACGLPVVVSNANFRDLLGAEAGRCVAEPTVEDVASKILAIFRNPDAALSTRLRAIVERDHSLKALIGRIIGVITPLL